MVITGLTDEPNRIQAGRDQPQRTPIGLRAWFRLASVHPRRSDIDTLIRALALLGLLAGCSVHVQQPNIRAVSDVGACGPTVPSPVPPPKPRSVETIAAWGNRTTIALEVANARLLECDRRHTRAVQALGIADIGSRR
jgi:hypothetical protein